MKLMYRNYNIDGLNLLDDEFFTPVIYNNIQIPDYLISNRGRVYSLRWKRLLKQSPDKDGYLRVGIVINGKNKTIKVHRLMLMTFMPIPNPDDFEGNHKNGIKNCNELWNLEWMKPIENTRHGWDTGLNKNKGEGNVRTYLKDQDIHQICDYISKGLRTCDICDKLGIYGKQDRIRMNGIISGIKYGKTYRDISSQYNIHGTNRRTRYSLDFADLVCQFLNDGNQYTYKEIMDLLQIPIEDRLFFKVYINDLLRGRTALEITSKYDNLKQPIELDTYIG